MLGTCPGDAFGLTPGAALVASLRRLAACACLLVLRCLLRLVLGLGLCLGVLCALALVLGLGVCVLLCPVLCGPVYTGLCTGAVVYWAYICLLCLKLGPFGKRAFVKSGFTEIRNSDSTIIAYFQLDSGLKMAFSCIFH